MANAKICEIVKQFNFDWGDCYNAIETIGSGPWGATLLVVLCRVIRVARKVPHGRTTAEATHLEPGKRGGGLEGVWYQTPPLMSHPIWSNNAAGAKIRGRRFCLHGWQCGWWKAKVLWQLVWRQKRKLIGHQIRWWCKGLRTLQAVTVRLQRCHNRRWSFLVFILGCLAGWDWPNHSKKNLYGFIVPKRYCKLIKPKRLVSDLPASSQQCFFLIWGFPRRAA